MKRKALIATFCLAALTAIGSMGLPWFPKTTNCGGNTAALSRCKMIHAQVQFSASEQGYEGISAFQSWPSPALKELVQLGRYHWTGEAHYLIKREIKFPLEGDSMLALCDTSFDNVPQPTIYNGYKRTPRYAAALANGKVKLITPEEFAKIDRSLFVKASELAEAEVKP